MLSERTAAEFRYAKDHPEESDPSRDMEVGSVAHLLVLQPHRFAERVVQIHGADYRKGAAKEARAAAYAAGLLPILCVDLDRAVAMRDALAAQIDMSLLTGGEPECSFVWQDAETGQLCKGRADMLHRSQGVIIDYKTTADPSRDAWTRRVAENGHHTQAAHYLDGAASLLPRRWSWAWVVQSTEPPYLAAAYEPAESWLHFGREKVREALALHRDCAASGVWPGLPFGLQRLEAPGWMAYRHEDWQADATARRQHRKPALSKADSALSQRIYAPL